MTFIQKLFVPIFKNKFVLFNNHSSRVSSYPLPATPRLSNHPTFKQVSKIIDFKYRGSKWLQDLLLKVSYGWW